MKYNNILKSIGVVALAVTAMTSCTDLDEKVYDRIDANNYYQDEAAVKGAVAPIYAQAAYGFCEYFWYLQEFPADQVAWRSWNGGLWGYDEAEKFVLSTQTWTSESKIIRSAWERAWTTIGLANVLISDLEAIDPANVGMTDEAVQMYIAEARTLRAWAYYNNFELWGGSLPLNTEPPSGNNIPGSADEDFNVGCQKIFDFISEELDKALPYLMVEDGSRTTLTRMNQGVNRMIKMRLLLNAELFTGTPKYTECAALAQDIIGGKYGNYGLVDDYREIYGYNNYKCPEIVFAFAEQNGQLNTGWMRNMPFLDSQGNIWKYIGGTYSQSGWNCCCLVPSHDNSGNVLPEGGTDTGGRSFLFDYGDKLGAVWDRMNDKDVRKQNYVYDAASNEWRGNFLKGAYRANYGTGEQLLGDADRQDMPLVYVDQIGTFQNKGRDLEVVMTSRWGETNSGIRMIKYPMLPESLGLDFQDIAEVEFRVSEAYYTLAECKMRQGDPNGARDLVNQVRQRYFADKNEVQKPGPGFNAFDMDWMLSEWGLEFLNEGRRRRTDLRRFDKFTQGQWWFFGRAEEPDRAVPAKRDRKYEWYPLPQAAIMVNPGLKQTPGYY